MSKLWLFFQQHRLASLVRDVSNKISSCSILPNYFLVPFQNTT